MSQRVCNLVLQQLWLDDLSASPTPGLTPLEICRRLKKHPDVSQVTVNTAIKELIRPLPELGLPRIEPVKNKRHSVKLEGLEELQGPHLGSVATAYEISEDVVATNPCTVHLIWTVLGRKKRGIEEEELIEGFIKLGLTSLPPSARLFARDEVERRMKMGFDRKYLIADLDRETGRPIILASERARSEALYLRFVAGQIDSEIKG